MQSNKSRMSSELANREANYTFCLELFRKNPSKEKQKELAQKQIIIDQYRTGLLLSTRWYTWKEIKDFDKDEDSMAAVSAPREPIDIPENDDDTVWAQKSKYYTEHDDDEQQFFATLTLDGLIEKLESMREKFGGDAPVFLVDGMMGPNNPVLKVTELGGSISLH